MWGNVDQLQFRATTDPYLDQNFVAKAPQLKIHNQVHQAHKNFHSIQP
jgi:hypothetical protein